MGETDKVPYKEGDEVEVKFMGYDDRKKMKLSRKVLLPRPPRPEKKKVSKEVRDRKDKTDLTDRRDQKATEDQRAKARNLPEIRILLTKLKIIIDY
jgi:predicted RNA-binding protein with RPS1 domain